MPGGWVLDRKVAIVSGGTYGIGRGITLSLAGRGWQVVAFGLESRQIGSAAENGTAGTRAELEQLGLDAELLDADVSQAGEVARVVDLTLSKFGRIDGLVNNAGIHPSGTALDTTEEVWDRVMEVNLKGMFLCARAVLPDMIARGNGAIVNIASRASYGQPNLLAYSASKGGVLGLTFALAYDHFQEGIRVNAVVPSSVLSGMNEGRPGTQERAQRSFHGRMAMPGDIGGAVAFLLSDEAEMITGAVLNVNSFLAVGGPLRNMP